MKLPREPLSNEEADRLANAADSFLEKLVIFTLLDTGFRVSELAGLTRDSIQWQEQRLVVYGKGGIYGKKSKRRVIPMTERVRHLLEHYFAVEDDIRSSKRTIQRLVKRVAKHAGITKPCTAYVLRHTFAVTCIKKNVSLRSVQTLLGHDRLTTTEIYLNLSPEFGSFTMNSNL